MNAQMLGWIPRAAVWAGASAAFAAGVLLGRRSIAHSSHRDADDDFTLGHFFEQTRDAAFVTHNGSVQQANSAAVEMFGYPRETLIGLPVSELLATAADEKHFVRALTQGPVTDYPLRLKTATGAVLDCLISADARFDAHGQVVGCRGLARDVTERNRIVEELQRAERDYRGLFEYAYDAILILQANSERVLDANHRACVLYGFTREEFIGRSMLELSVDPVRAKSNLRRAHEGSDRYATFESQQRRNDGTVMDLEINAAEIPYKGVPAILSINRDITARRKAENAIRESEERFRLLLETITDYAIVMLDPSGRIVSWNEGAEWITGYAQEEVLGHSAAMFWLSEDEPRLQERLEEASREGRVEYQTTRVRKDGTEFTASVTIAPIVDEANALRGYAAITHDISTEIELARAREEVVTVLRNVAREWQETFDAVAVPIVLLNCDGTIRRVNRAAQLLTAQPFQSLVGKAATEIDGEPWRTIAALGAATAAQRSAGSTRAIEDDLVWQVSSSLVGDGDEEHVIVVAYDLTLVSRLEATVRRNEVAAALGSLVAGVAHEVRNPLFTISATLDAWEARYSQEEGVRRYASLMRGQTDRLGRLMHDLLDYGKPNPLQIASASVADVIRTAAADCAAIATERSASIELTLDALPPSAIDSARLEQVFQNVIDNAIRHSPAGGTVHVSAAMDEGVIVCRIADEGSGIGEQDPATMFQPFYTRRRGGTGLGLSIAQKFITAHGGEIAIANRGDRSGTEVLIRLPFREPELSASSGVRAG